MTELTLGAPDYTPQALRTAYLECLFAPDARGARELMAGALASGVPAAQLYVEVITPAMHDVGRRWQAAEVSVAQEHLATQITRAVIAMLAGHIAAAAPVGRGRTAIVTSSPGEQHVLGVQMVCDFLEAQGWDVLNLGADTPAAELVKLVGDSGAELVALSTAISSHLGSVTQACELLRRLEPPPFIVAGGSAYHGDHEQALTVGADAFCDDPQDLLELLQQRFGDDAQH